MALLTSARDNVYEVSFLPAGRSVTEEHRLPRDEWDPDPFSAADQIVEHYEESGHEVLEVIFVPTPPAEPQSVYRNKRFF